MTTMDARTIDIAKISEISSGATYYFISDRSYEARIEDLILLSSEQTIISAGLETLEDLVSEISEEIRMRGLATDSKFDVAVHETKYEEFQRRYKAE